MNKFLKLNQQFFSADGGDGGNPDGGGTPPNNDDPMIPKVRFDEVNNKYKQTKTDYDTLLNEKNQWTSKQQEFENNLQNATNELNNYKTKATQHTDTLKGYETFLDNLLKTKVEGLPEGASDLIPDGSLMSKLDWLFKAEAKNFFGNFNSNSPLGGATNFNNNQQQDTSKMSAFEKMSLSYQNATKQ
jgi:hypothetical protein